MYRAIEFTIFTGGKWRTFCDPSEALRIDLEFVSSELLRILPSLKGPSRKIQSKLDMAYYQKYSYVELMDVRKALLSGNIVIVCFFSVLFYPRVLKLLPKLLKIYFAQIYDDHGIPVRNRRNRLKAGFKTSELVLALAFRPWLMLFRRIGGEFNLYVDDLALYSSSRALLKSFSFLLRCYFWVLGFRFHKREFYALRSRPRKCGARLGLLFCFRKDGSLETKIRQRTINRYLDRISYIAKTCTCEVALNRLCRSLHKSEFFPLYESFDKTIWTSRIQRVQFFARVCGILKRKFPELRGLKKNEIAKIIWAHRVIQ